MSANRPLVLSRPGGQPAWAERLPGMRIRSGDGVPESLDAFDSVWIDAHGLRPLDLARQVAARDPAVQTIVVAPPEELGVHERALLFTPGLGEVWLITPDDVEPGTLERAREITDRRRQYRKSRPQMSDMLARGTRGQSPRAVVSDAYLAALLHVLPDPVVSVDDADQVVSWSEAAETSLGTRRRNALGRPVVEVLSPDDPAALRSALEQGRSETAEVELILPGATGLLIMETVITPVEATGVNVRAVVLRDVTSERELIMQLEREVEFRSRFYAAMSHEIRTPINAIMGYNELLRTGMAEPSKRQEYLERSQKAASHLLALVSDVLDLSRLESGGLTIERESTSIGPVIHGLVANTEMLARDRNTPLEVHCAPQPGEIWTDTRRLNQILINLVTNALKFGEGRPVSIRCGREEDWVIFEVQDRGQGIAPQDQERIFEEFAQVGPSGEGTGLGLPISRKLAELLGGELAVDSEVGKGSTFRLRLPAHP